LASRGERRKLDPMLSGSYQLIVGGAVFAAFLVFVAAFRFALRECAETRELACQPDIPRASIHAHGASRWLRGQHRQRALRGVKVLQAGFVAVGITSVFVMTLCMAGVIGVLLFG
jgi:Sec-independent protein secretion pathway component TatC